MENLTRPGEGILLILFIAFAAYAVWMAAKVLGIGEVIRAYRLGYFVAYHADPNQTIDPLDPNGAVEVVVINKRFGIEPNDPEEQMFLHELASNLAQDLDCASGSVRIGPTQCIFRFTRLDVLTQATRGEEC